MLRVSPSCWVKTSVEFEPHESNRLGAVVTNAQYSDWSTQPLSDDITTVWFRIRAEAADCIVESSFDGMQWQQLRMGISRSGKARRLCRADFTHAAPRMLAMWPSSISLRLFRAACDLLTLVPTASAGQASCHRFFLTRCEQLQGDDQ